MFKESRLAILLRSKKWIYAPYLSLMAKLSRREYKELQTFLFFLGYPRSGSSILGSIIDAHENCIVSHELNVLKYIEKRYSRDQIFFMIEKNSQLFTKKNRLSSGYPGIVPDQNNSSAASLKLIGDKKAGGTALLLERNKNLLAQLKHSIGLDIKCIHIVRNPFDMITTQAYGGNEKRKEISAKDLDKAILLCFSKFSTTSEIIKSGELTIYTLKHENLLEKPQEELKSLFTWLGLDVSLPYLTACEKLLFKNPHQSRLKYKWSEEEKNRVMNKINKFDFLKGYTFEN
jgi:hypothetical protein